MKYILIIFISLIFQFVKYNILFMYCNYTVHCTCHQSHIFFGNLFQIYRSYFVAYVSLLQTIIKLYCNIQSVCLASLLVTIQTLNQEGKLDEDITPIIEGVRYEGHPRSLDCTPASEIISTKRKLKSHWCELIDQKFFFNQRKSISIIL